VKIFSRHFFFSLDSSSQKMATATRRFFSRKLAELNEAKTSTSTLSTSSSSSSLSSQAAGGAAGATGKDFLKDLDEDLRKVYGEGIQQRNLRAEEVRTKSKVVKHMTSSDIMASSVNHDVIMGDVDFGHFF